MNRTIHDVQQGSPEWHALRANHYTASEAPAMMGTSPYMTRSELLRLKAGGVEREIDAAAQRRFDDGHEAEAVARPQAEAYLQEDLYPVTITVDLDGLPLLASMDGLTMDEATGFECKLWSQRIEAMIEAAEIADSHWPQLEQQMLVSGAERILFVGCDKEQIRGLLWYESRPERRAAIIAGWKQFEEDRKSYQHVEAAQKAVAAPVEGFGALVLQVEGKVLACNIEKFKADARAFIDRLPKAADLTTDQNFADAEAAVKACKEAETRICAAKDAAMAQMGSIDDVFRAVDLVLADIAAARLTLDKVVKGRKESIRMEIMQDAQAKLAEHVKNLNERIGWFDGCPIISPAAADFATAIKGKKTVASLRDACDTELARAKIATSEIADRIEANKKAIGAHAALFPDFPHVCTKTLDDFANLVAVRIAQDKERQEQARLESERERIRAEEQARAEREQNAAQQAAQAVQAPSGGQPQEPAVAAPTLGQVLHAASSDQIANAMADTGARMKLGEINAAIAPLSISAEGLRQLGFEPAGNEKRAMLYRTQDFPMMCAAMVRHLQRAAVVNQGMKKAA
jgi:putative phage-type endonuclease